MFNDVGGQHGKPYHPGDGKYVFNKRPTIFFIVECVDLFLFVCVWGGGGGGGGVGSSCSHTSFINRS